MEYIVTMQQMQPRRVCAGGSVFKGRERAQGWKHQFGADVTHFIANKAKTKKKSMAVLV